MEKEERERGSQGGTEGGRGNKNGAGKLQLHAARAARVLVSRRRRFGRRRRSGIKTNQGPLALARSSKRLEEGRGVPRHECLKDL